MDYISGFDAEKHLQDTALIPQGEPFWLQAKENNHKAVVICLHGYTASPYEAKPIGVACQNKGLDALGPLMPGHGLIDTHQAKQAMFKVKYTDWLNAVRSEIERAKKQYQHVFIFGQSMGGALALSMCSEGLVEAGAMTAPAIILPRGAGLSSTLTHFLPITIPKKDINTFHNISYKFQDPKSGYELLTLSRYTRSILSKIACPIFLAHSHNDPIITPRVPGLIQKNVRGSIAIQWYDQGKHTLPLDVQGQEISEAIASFFLHHL